MLRPFFFCVTRSFGWLVVKLLFKVEYCQVNLLFFPFAAPQRLRVPGSKIVALRLAHDGDLIYKLS